MTKSALQNLISSGSSETRRLNSAKQPIIAPRMPVESEAPASPSAAKRTFTVILALPDRKLSPNGRCHWRVKAKLVKEHRQRAMTAALAVSRSAPMIERATILLRWFHPTKRPVDTGNAIASCKAYEDGICDAQWILNDAGVDWLPVERAKDAGNPRVELVITEL